MCLDFTFYETHSVGCRNQAFTLTNGRACLGQLPISTDCVFDASLVPETCLEFPSLPV